MFVYSECEIGLAIHCTRCTSVCNFSTCIRTTQVTTHWCTVFHCAQAVKVCMAVCIVCKCLIAVVPHADCTVGTEPGFYQLEAAADVSNCCHSVCICTEAELDNKCEVPLFACSEWFLDCKLVVELCPTLCERGCFAGSTAVLFDFLPEFLPRIDNFS